MTRLFFKVLVSKLIFSNTIFSKALASRFLCLVFTFFSSLSQAEIYQWQDTQGRTHFGDRPPQDARANNITDQVQSINISKDMSSPEMMLKLEQLKAEEQQRLKDEHQQKRKQQRADSKACREAQRQLLKLKGRVFFVDEQGKELKVTEAERKERVLALEDNIKLLCQ